MSVEHIPHSDTGTWAVRALSVQQPWAECIARGAKPVENRRRPFSYRGPLAIHASRGWSAPGGHEPLVIRALAGGRAARPITQRIAAARLGMAFGAVLALAQLADCHLDAGCCRPWGEPGVYHLVLTDIRRLPHAVPARGHLGLWTVQLTLDQIGGAA